MSGKILMNLQNLLLLFKICIHVYTKNDFWVSYHKRRLFPARTTSIQTYAHKFGNLDDMDQYLEKHNLPKFTQEEIDNMNRLMVCIKETESIINNLLKWKASNGFTGKFYQTNRSHKYSQLIFDREANAIQWRKTVFSTNASGTTGHPHA